jgi:signal transduction histidine kinase
VSQRKVVFARRAGNQSPLMAVMDANEVVLLPLLTAQTCLGVLACAVPPELSHHLRIQLPTLQSFGVYAGLALSRRREADKKQPAQTLSAKQAQQLELKRVSQAINLLVEALSKTDQDAPMASVDLSLAVLQQLHRVAHRQLVPGNIEINTELPNRDSWVHGSVGQIKQMLLILIKNAYESMPDGGQIVVNGGVLVHREGSVYAALTVSDSGASLKEAIQAQLYEPMHATGRGDSDRQGFGLSVVNKLVEKMNGRLKFVASPAGTRFDILLPCARTAPV